MAEAELQKKKSKRRQFRSLTFTYEQEYWRNQIAWVAGIDEVGVGALAGPVVAGAVMFESRQTESLNLTDGKDKIMVRDSKQLTPEQRVRMTEWIKEHCLAWAVAEASLQEIHELNILKASRLAMRRAVEQLATQPEILLIDGNPAQVHPTVPAVNVIGGDRLVFSIAAASILAKTYRDSVMERLAQKYPEYGFEQHKGYGTPDHLAALKTFGASPLHRIDYAPVALLLTRS